MFTQLNESANAFMSNKTLDQIKAFTLASSARLIDRLNACDSADYASKDQQKAFDNLLVLLTQFQTEIKKEQHMLPLMEKPADLEPDADAEAIKKHRANMKAYNDEEAKKLNIAMTTSRWMMLYNTINLANELLREATPTHDRKNSKRNPAKDKLVKDEVTLLIETMKYATNVVKDPEFASNDHQSDASEYKTLQNKIEAHIATNTITHSKRIAWTALLGSLSFMVGVAMIATGILLLGPTLGSSSGLLLGGLFLTVYGAAAAVMAPVASGLVINGSIKVNEDLTARRTKEILTTNVNAFHQKPKAQQVNADATDAKENKPKK